MIAVAYRNISGAALSMPDRRVNREIQRSGAHSLLRDLLEREAGSPASQYQLVTNGSRKPILLIRDAPTAIDVSVSHSGSLAAAALTDLGDIGVDLEYRGPRRLLAEVAAYAFGPEERRMIESAGPRAFYRIWTMREAMAKACGIGFPMLVDRRDYFANAPTSGSWQSVIDGRRWLFSTDELPGDYAIAVALALRSPLAADRPDLTARRFD
jgi:4'-phosphopantetheinyl transferase